MFRDATGWHLELLATGERGEGAFGVTGVPDHPLDTLLKQHQLAKLLGLDAPPVPTKMPNDEMVLHYPVPDWTANLRRAGSADQEGIVFVDELNSAPPALQPALMGLVLDKRIGGSQLGKRVRVIGAMNPIGHAAGGWDLAAPVANRFGHLRWDCPDVDEWTAWLCGGSTQLAAVDVDAEEKRVMETWPDAYAKASGLVAAFVRRRPELLHKQPPDNDPAASGPWPSPRTWEFATRALAASYVHGLTEVEADELLSSFVGVDAASEFVAWIENQDLPDPADLLDGNVKWAHDVERFDRTVAVLASCTALVTPPTAIKRDKRADALWGLLATLMDSAKDLAVPPAKALAQAGLQRCPSARTVMVKMHNVVMAARDKAF
jgi:hypothetical protein